MMMRPMALSLLLGILGAQSVMAAPGKLTLDQAIARALSTHPDALIARAQLDQAGLSVAEVNAQRFQVTADASVLGRHAQTGLLGNVAQGTTTDQTGINGTIGLTVPIFTGGKLTQGVLAAERNREASEYQGALTRAELRFEVTRAFWNLARQEALAKVQQETIEQAQRTLALTKTSFGLGRVTSNDVDRAEVDSLTTQDSLLRLQAQTQEAQARLAALVGVPTTELAIETSEGAAGGMTWPDPEKALLEHPRVRAAEARVAAARASVAAANGDRWPQLALITTYQHGNNPFDPLSGARGLGSFSGTWDARVSANLNVFDNGRIGRDVAKAEAELAIAQANLEKTRREVRSTLELALIRAKSAQERLALAERSSRIASKTLNWVETRYEQGYTLLVDVLDSRRSLLSSRTQRIDAQVDFQIARAELALALGQAE